MGQAVGEAAAAYQLYHEPGVRMLVGVDDVMDGHDVQVLEPGEGSRLAQHSVRTGTLRGRKAVACKRFWSVGWPASQRAVE